MKKVSLKDIANRVGVSIALVSYVLNGKKQGRISKDVSQKIKDVAKELNYTTNQIARSLKTNKTYTLGLIVADISNAFSSTLARIIEDEAEKSNYTVIFGSSDESASKSEKLINTLLNHQVDGLIIAPVEGTEKQLLSLQEREIPFVLIDRYFPQINCSYVAIDNFKAAYALVNLLIEKGYKRIGIITFRTELFHLQERKRGYITALKDEKITGKKAWIKEVGNEHTKEEVEKAINDLLVLPEPVNAILFASNYLSMYGMKHINTLQINVPADLALVSFDESDAADLFYAPLTHMKQPLQEMAQLATKILLESIDKNNKVMQVNMQAELIVRKSTERS